MDTDQTNDHLTADLASGAQPEVEAELLHYELEADVLFVTSTTDAVETPLAAEDEAALEDGIASMFEELVQSDVAYVEAPETEPVDAETPDPTFALLDELNRIWAQPIAA